MRWLLVLLRVKRSGLQRSVIRMVSKPSSVTVTEIPIFANLGPNLAAAQGNVPTGERVISAPESVDGSVELDSQALSERDLIQRARRDPEAFAELYRSNYDLIAGYIRRRVGDVHAADDLVADVFLTAMRSLPRFRYRGIPIRAWLYRIATNLVNRWAKRRHRGHAMFVEFSATRNVESSDPADGRIDVEQARAAMMALAPKHQAVLALHYLEGLPLEEVAFVTGRRIGTVKSRLSRAREALRERLSQGRF